MKVSHHLDQSTIVSYASGTLDEALSAVVACHIAWCSECRQAVRHAEIAGGVMLDELAPAKLSATCLDEIMARLDDESIEIEPSRTNHGDDGSISGVPRPLAKMIGGRALDEVEWRKVGSGVWFHDLPVSEGAKGKLRLMKIAAGKAMPEHSHGGMELTLVLRGAYRDAIGHFGIGDIADLDETIGHKPVVTPDEPCICLVATEAPTRFKSLVGRIMQPIVGI